MNKHILEELSKTTDKKRVVFTAMSKHYFYYRMFISKFCLEQGVVPINSFMSFDYFMLDSVDHALVHTGNNNLIARSDELWVFGPISHGVLVEITWATKLNLPIKFFCIAKDLQIKEIEKEAIELENTLDDTERFLKL